MGSSVGGGDLCQIVTCSLQLVVVRVMFCCLKCVCPSVSVFPSVYVSVQALSGRYPLKYSAFCM